MATASFTPASRSALPWPRTPLRYGTGGAEPVADLIGGLANRGRDRGDGRVVDPGIGAGDADARHDDPGPVEHRPGHAAQVGLELLPVHRVPAAAHLGELAGQLAGVGDRAVCSGFQAAAGVARGEL